MASILTRRCTWVISLAADFCIKLVTMRIRPKPALAALFCGLAFHVASAQREPRRTENLEKSARRRPAQSAERTLTSDEGLSIIAAALDPKVRRRSEPDCSHLVNAIYKRAGFSYAYARSSDLYAGVEGFRRVSLPQPGDLVVWRGHVGIVVRPSHHVVVSFLTSGPGIDDYKAPYWINRGRPRFYRYVKNDHCPGCPLIALRHTPGDK